MEKQPKILVVDDADFARKMIIQILGEAGYVDILEAKNGKEALALYEKHRPDLILLDLIMPEFDGIGVLKELQKQAAPVKVVVVTAVGGVVMEKEASGSFQGVVGYLHKPFEAGEILGAVKKAS